VRGGGSTDRKRRQSLVVNSAPVYLDYNATTPILPEVVDAMLPFLREHFGNPSSKHHYGRIAHDAVERARGEVAALIGSESEEVIFTSGGTEANNLAIIGMPYGDRRGIVTSVVEHPAVAQTVSWLERRGFHVTRLCVDANGQVSTRALESAIDDSTALVTLMHANNETGVLQPIQVAARAAHRVSARLHTDAAQSVGKVPVDVRALDVDLLSIVGHKLYAPKGVGALYARRGVALEPVTLGPGHERGLRPGTENVASIVGLGTACSIARRDLDRESARVRRLRDLLWSRLSASVPGLALSGHATDRLPNTLNVRFPNVSALTLLSRADGIAASTGSACHAGSEQPSAVLLGMGIAPEEALGAVRLSLGRQTTEADVDRAVKCLADAWLRAADTARRLSHAAAD
jgi:cysteine desulfurase